MDTKYYLIGFLLCAVLLFLFLWRKAENFEQNHIDKLIHLNEQPNSKNNQDSKDIILKNVIKNVLDDTPTCQTTPIINNLYRDDTDLKIKYLHHLVKLNGLRWSLKKINDLEK